MVSNHVWSIGFVHDKLSDGRRYKMLTVLDEYTRQALAVDVATRMTAGDVLEVLLTFSPETGPLRTGIFHF